MATIRNDDERREFDDARDEIEAIFDEYASSFATNDDRASFANAIRRDYDYATDLYAYDDDEFDARYAAYITRRASNAIRAIFYAATRDEAERAFASFNVDIDAYLNA